jgi:hypothetical protein
MGIGVRVLGFDAMDLGVVAAAARVCVRCHHVFG